MDIIVQGEGKKFYKPTEVIISINFYDNEGFYPIPCRSKK